MQVKVRLFAALRERVGQAELVLELPPEATARDAWQALRRSCPALDERERFATAVNRTYVDLESSLAEGDELAFIPPVSGG